MNEIAIDVPLPEEPTEMSGLDHGRSILHSLAWLATNATPQGSQDEPLVTCREA